jgi:hypothetical protein
MRGDAPVMCWRPTHEAAVAEAVRLTVVFRQKFGRPDAPPYRVRKRRKPDSHHDLWRVYVPTGRIPERRAA